MERRRPSVLCGRSRTLETTAAQRRDDIVLSERWSAGLTPAGTYAEFEFEDLDEDGDDDTAKRLTMQNILARLREAYPAFPSNASMVVHGVFTPAGGSAQEFTVYFAAEIKVEQEFDTPFRVPEDGTITVKLNLVNWFQTGSQVLNRRRSTVRPSSSRRSSRAESEGVEHEEHDDD